MSDLVRDFIEKNAVAAEIITLPTSTATSKEAAEALRCPLAQIAKSILFLGDEPVLVVISGDRRVDIGKLSRLLGGQVKIAPADEVKQVTGFSAGGVPPFPHPQNVKTILDESITRFDEVYTSAGTSDSLMKIKVSELKRLTRGLVADVSQ